MACGGGWSSGTGMVALYTRQALNRLLSPLFASSGASPIASGAMSPTGWRLSPVGREDSVPDMVVKVGCATLSWMRSAQLVAMLHAGGAGGVGANSVADANRVLVPHVRSSRLCTRVLRTSMKVYVHVLVRVRVLATAS